MGKEYKKLSREELYQQVWEKPMSQLAKQYGISDVGLAKICRKMGIPLPGRGHWARVSAGRIPPRPRLPSPKKGQLEEAYLNVKTNIKHQSPEQTEVDKIIAREKEADNQVIVREVLQDPHDLIVRTVKSLRGAKVNERQLVRPRAQSCLDVEVTKDSIDRAMRIMDALLKGLEERGYEISIDPEKKFTQVEMLKETLSIKLEERINRVDHVRTSQEEKRCSRDRFYHYKLPRHDYIPTGNLVLSIDGQYYLNGVRKSWADGKVQRLENCLNNIVAGLIQAAAVQKEERLERERRERRWEEEQRRREELRARYKEEQKRLETLLKQTQDWVRAQEIRAYIVAVSSSEQSGKDGGVDEVGTQEWHQWASQQAARLDPLMESPPSVLDENISPYW